MSSSATAYTTRVTELPGCEPFSVVFCSEKQRPTAKIDGATADQFLTYSWLEQYVLVYPRGAVLRKNNCFPPVGIPENNTRSKNTAAGGGGVRSERMRENSWNLNRCVMLRFDERRDKNLCSDSLCTYHASCTMRGVSVGPVYPRQSPGRLRGKLARNVSYLSCRITDQN